MSLSALLQGQTLPLGTDHQLRLMRETDLPATCEMLNDPEVNKYLFFAPAPNEFYLEYLTPLLAMEAQQSAPVLTIADQNDRFLGMVALTQTEQNGELEIGYQLSQAAWGKGLATRAGKFLLTLAFDKFNAKMVKANCYDTNLGSKRVCEKLGLGRIGKDAGFHEDGTVDRCWFAITREQYERSKLVASL